MARKIDWEADRFRKRKGPLISEGMQTALRREAKELAARLKSGKNSANASKCGPVLQLSREEIEKFAAERGLKVSGPRTPSR